MYLTVEARALLPCHSVLEGVYRLMGCLSGRRHISTFTIIRNTVYKFSKIIFSIAKLQINSFIVREIAAIYLELLDLL